VEVLSIGFQGKPSNGSRSDKCGGTNKRKDGHEENFCDHVNASKNGILRID
jgi:hypothetical protein